MSDAPPPNAGPPRPQVKALNCPHCGAALTLRSFDNAVTVVCESCHSILDAKDPNLKVLQQFKMLIGEDPPLIPLGTRGKIRGTDYDVIGFQRRTIKSEGVRYDWHEYLLFNPYKGFRYLTEYMGHWNDISICKDLPILGHDRFADVNYMGELYKHFQTAEAKTNYVLGEFPWQVRVGETATVTDYVKPPRVLSSERMTGEMTWSIGEYIQGRDIWKAFGLRGSPPDAVGVYENQPSPVSGSLNSVLVLFAVFAALLVAIGFLFLSLHRNEQVLMNTYFFGQQRAGTEPSFITRQFDLDGRTSNVEITTEADVNNNWIYLNYALINADTGQAWDFGREVSYYSGYDSDGAWTEGNKKDVVVVPSVPAGHYYLRIEPESDPTLPHIYYSVTVTRDVLGLAFYGWGFLALLLPAVGVGWRSISFERERWSESDHPPMALGDS
jgi:hypothetical protein